MIVSLKNLAEATPQQVFDQVVTHMRTQKVQAKGPEGCAYRAGALMCAAGCLIADDEYMPEMDQAGTVEGHTTGSNWDSLVRRQMVPRTQHSDLIIDLQNTHDNYAGPQTWEGRFERLAKQYNLQFTPV